MDGLDISQGVDGQVQCYLEQGSTLDGVGDGGMAKISHRRGLGSCYLTIDEQPLKSFLCSNSICVYNIFFPNIAFL
jgi:hypothetical protein